jgi:uncharacterized protein (TIGR02757 family)
VNPLDTLYQRYNRRAFVNPDPLETVLRFDDPADQEIAGLVAAALAFGNVKQILISVERVLKAMDGSPSALVTIRPKALQRRLAGFRHRYVTDAEVLDLLLGAQRLLRAHASLGHAFASGVLPGDADVIPALARFCAALRADAALQKNYLIPDPARGSACKRMLMYLRWMLRHDDVDPGPWRELAPARLHAGMLLVPIDTHMHRMARRLGLTQRATADLRTAREVTCAFQLLRPADPVRYDFALTRLGIRKDLDYEAFVETFLAWKRKHGVSAPLD